MDGGAILKVDENVARAYTAVEETVECRFSAEVFGGLEDHVVEVSLRVRDVLEEFEGRRVLLAAAEEILESELELDAEQKAALLHPTYVIEETTLVTSRLEGWPDEIQGFVRSPVCVQEVDGLVRSVFMDNMGISVGDFVDLVRGDLGFDQVRIIFRTVGKLFQDLHKSGWIHLGATPWNVRLFDPNTEDGFPKVFVSESLGEAFSLEPAVPVEEQEHAVEETDFEGGDRTVLEIAPLSVADFEAGDEVSDASSEDEVIQEEEGEQEEGEKPNKDREGLAGSSFYDSQVEWSDVAEESEGLGEDPPLQAIFDGIDRLYRVGHVEEEVAVTPGFSAPELLTGMGTRDGESADLFSLGMFLYFLVAGEIPPASVYTRYAPAIPARNFRPGFPPGLHSVISRATRPRPEDRFASVESMMEAFEDACDVVVQRAQAARFSPPAMRLASDTHIGISKRRRNPVNQDHVFSGRSDDGRFALIVVADGVSTASYGSGDLASAALAKEAAAVWEDVLPAYLMDEVVDDVKVIQKILRRANHHIVNYVNENHAPFRGSPHEVMGSTALVALIMNGQVTLGALGDSRVYLQRGAAMEQMTIDHNLWTLSILEGIHADSALAMPHGDALARCLGTFVVEQGTLRAVDPQPDVFRFRVIDGDTLLLTTDGLVDFAGTNQLASEDNILSVMLAEPDPALACLELILLANRGGGGDNIGLSVVRFF